MGNAYSILGEGALVTRLLKPLSTIKADNHAREDTPLQYTSSSEHRWMSQNSRMS